MGNCKFTVKDKNGKVKKEGLSETDFKKYLAKEGLSEYINSGEITTDMSFLKDYLVAPKEQSVKEGIKEATGLKNAHKETPISQARKEGKYEGEIKTTEKLSKKIEQGKERLEQSKAKIQEIKDSVKEKIADIKEQGKSLADITKALRDDIKGQIKGAKDIFRGAKIRGNVVKGLLNKINNAKTPLQLLSAVDYVAKTLQDVEYTNKLDAAKALANKVKRISGNLPINIKTAVNNLAKASPKEIKDVNEYINLMNKAVEEITQSNPSGINEDAVNKLAETINKNNLKNRIDLVTDLLARRMSSDKVNSLKDAMNAKLKEAKTADEKQSIREEYREKINDEIEAIKQTFDKPVSDSIEDMKKSLEEFKGLLDINEGDVLSTEEKQQQKRDNLEAINEVLRDEISDFDTSELDKDDLELFNAINEIDISKLSDKDLKFLNYSLNNFIENGSFDGVGAFILSKYKYQRDINKQGVRALIDNTILKINSLGRFIQQRGSLDTVLNSLFSNTKAIAAIRFVSGFGDWSNKYGAKTGFKGKLKTNLDEVSDILKKTGVDKSLESQIKLGAILDITQYDTRITPEEIQAEFEGRKEAMLTSIERSEAELEKSDNWKREREDIIKAEREAYDKYVKDAKTPQELIDKLTDNEKAVRDVLLKKFSDMAEAQEKLVRTYKNEEFDKKDNYFPRAYIPLTDSQLKSEDITINSLIDNAGFRSTGNIQTTQSTTFKNRVLKGAQVKKNNVVNYNVIDVFQDQYRKQLYDLETYKERFHTYSTISSPEFLELLGGNKDVLMAIHNSFVNRYANEVTSLQSAKDTNLIQDIGNLVTSSAVRSSIGGLGIPYIKQYAATMASVICNLNPNIWLQAISVIAKNGDAFHKFIENSPVSLRHDQEVATTGGNISAKDLKKISSSVRRKVQGLNDISDKVLMKSLVTGDQSSAGLAYLSYYIKNLQDRGIIKSVLDFDINKASENPDKIAQQFAEQETATSLNINEAVNKPANPLFKNLAFVNFAINSKLNAAINVGKLIEANGVMSPNERLQALRKIGAHVGETYAFNKVGQLIRYVGYAGAASLFGSLIKGSDDDEETKDKIKLYLDKTFNTLIENNEKNSETYFYHDLLFGQIGETWAKPITEHATNAFSNLYYNIKGDDENSKGSLYTTKEAAQTALSVLGVKGIAISNAIDLTTGANDLYTMSSDTRFRMNKFGYVNALDDKVIPLADINKKAPSFAKYAQSASFLSQVLSFTTGSPKELQIFTNRIPTINKSIITGMYGKDKKVVTEKERYSKLEPTEFKGKKYYVEDKFSNVEFGGVEYILNTEQTAKRIKYKNEVVQSIYNNWMKMLPKALKENRPDFIKQLKENPTIEKIKGIQDFKEIQKYPYKYTNEQILNIANELSKVYILNENTKKKTDGTSYLNLQYKDELK
jgi:hypothetical protein